MKSQDNALHGTPGEAEVLQRRAAQLARSAGAADTGVPALAFAIGGRPCVLELRWLRELRVAGELMPLPLAPPQLLGLVQLRERLLPVIDVGALLGVAGAKAAVAERLLVLGRDAPEFAIAASEPVAILQLSIEDAARRSAPLESLRPDLVRGVTPDGRLFLDGEQLLTLHRPAGP